MLFRVDPATSAATGELKLTGQKGTVTTAFGSVWATTDEGNKLLRITPAR